MRAHKGLPALILFGTATGAVLLFARNAATQQISITTADSTSEFIVPRSPTQPVDKRLVNKLLAIAEESIAEDDGAESVTLAIFSLGVGAVEPVLEAIEARKNKHHTIAAMACAYLLACHETAPRDRIAATFVALIDDEKTDEEVRGAANEMLVMVAYAHSPVFRAMSVAELFN